MYNTSIKKMSNIYGFTIVVVDLMFWYTKENACVVHDLIYQPLCQTIDDILFLWAYIQRHLHSLSHCAQNVYTCLNLANKSDSIR